MALSFDGSQKCPSVPEWLVLVLLQRRVVRVRAGAVVHVAAAAVFLLLLSPDLLPPLHHDSPYSLWPYHREGAQRSVPRPVVHQVVHQLVHLALARLRQQKVGPPGGPKIGSGLAPVGELGER